MLAQPPRTISPLAAAVTFFQGSGVLPAEASQLAHLLTEFCSWQADPSSWSVEGWATFIGQLPADRQPTDTHYQLATQFLNQFPASQIEVALPKFVLALKLNKCSNSTVRNYRSDISQFFTFCRTSIVTVGLTKNQIAAFERFQDQNGLQPSSIKRKTSSLQHFWQWCEEHGLLQLEVPVTVQAVRAVAETPVIKPNPEPALIKPAEPKVSQPALEPKKPQVEIIPPRPRVKKVSTRQNWKQGIERLNSVFKASQGWVTYLNLAILVLFILGLGVFGYQQFFKTANTPLAYPSTPVEPNRILSFQGRLTDTNQNPITSSTSMVFSIYNHPSNGAYTDTPGDTGPLLWQGSCSVTPDQDGIFNTNLGDGTCGAEINEFVFSENASTYLEVRVGSETLTPRQPIRTVAYALNAETLQGYPISATGAATVNTILFMDGGGSVVLGEVNPEIRSLSGTFTLEGRSLLFQTTSGSNGDIVLDADGIGGVISRDYVYAPGATISATYAGGVPLTVQGGPSGTAHIADINNSSGTNLAYFASDGALTVTQAAAYNSTLQANTLAFSRNAENYVSATNATGSLIFRTGGSNNRLTISSSGNFDFATGTTAFNGLTYTWPGSQSAGYILSTNGSGTLTWVDPALAGAGSIFWSQSNGALYPKNSTVDVLIGGQSSSSADFAFLNVNSGTPVASFSGWLTFNSAGRISTTNNQSLSLNGSGGNVGIGTVNPTYGMDVWSQGSNIARFRISGGAQLLLSSSTTPGSGSINLTSDDLVTSGLSFSTRNSVGTGVRMVINNNGYIGINTTSPLGTLDTRAQSGTIPVASFSGATAFATLVADNSGVGDIFTASSSGLNRFVITQNGNVGIGTSIPATLLDVAGPSAAPSGSPAFPVRVTAGTGTPGFVFERTDASRFVNLWTGTSGAVLGFTDTASRLAIGSYSYANRYNQGFPATEVMSLLPTGNVGIGSTTPAYQLEISSILPMVGLSNTGAGGTSFNLYSTGNASSYGGGRLVFRQSSTALMTLDSNGNLGIGTTSPIADLHVVGNYGSNAALVVDQLNSGNIIAASASGTNRMVLTNAGYLGLGTTAPSQALHVVGNAYFDTSAGELTIQNTGSGSVELLSSGSLVLDTAAASSIGFQVGNATLATLFNNNFGIGDTSPAAMLTVGNGDLFQVNSSGNIAAIGGVAHALANSSGNLVLSSNGELYLSDTRTGNIALTVADTALDAGLPQGLVDAINEIYGTTIGNSLWSTGNGALYPVNSTLDLLVGGQSTASARFALTNINSGAVTATMSGTTAGYALSLNGDGAIQTSLNRTLTLNATGGRVGIGTSSPDFDFAVGSITTTGRIGAAETGAWPANTDYAYFGNQALDHSATGNYALLQSNVGSTYLNAASGRQIFFALNNSVIGAVSSAGNWGIGPGFDSTNATATLDVAGSASLSGTLSFRGTTDPTINILNGESFVIRTSPGGDAGVTDKLSISNQTTSLYGNRTSGVNARLVALGGAGAPGIWLNPDNIGASDTYTILRADGGSTDNLFTIYGNARDSVNVGTISTETDHLFAVFNQTANEIAVKIRAATSQTNNLLELQNSSGTGLSAFDENGYLGIGTITPTNALELATGNFQINAQGDLRLADSDSTNYAAIQAPTTIGTNYTLTLPDNDGDSGQVLSTDGSGVLSWVAAGTNYWNQTNGSLFPLNSTVDVFFGGQASASANFAFLNNNSGTPTASIAGSLTLNHASGAIQSTNNRSLTIGGSTTGNIIMMPNNGSGGRIAVGTTAPEGFAHLYRSSSTRGYSLDGNDMLVLEAFSTNRLKWVSGNTAHQILSFSDQDSEDMGVISYMHDIDAMGFATNGTTAMRINSSQNIGIGTTTINERLQIAGGNIFINTQGDMRFGDSDSSNYAAIQAPATIGTNYTLTLPDTDGDSGQVLSTDGSGVLSWTSAATLSSIFWYQGNGALYPANSTVDVLFGGQSSASADIAFINLNSGTPTASISGNLTLNSAGVIATTNQQPLNIGDSNTGNINFYSDGTHLMTMRPDGNIGIGTTSSNRVLTIVDADGVSSNTQLLYLKQQNSDAGYSFNLEDASSGRLYVQGVTGGSESNIMTFDRNLNNVGIGTTAPTNVATGWGGASQVSRLWLRSTGGSDYTSLVIAGSAGGAIQFTDTSGTPTADFGTSNGSEIGFANRQNAAINFYTNGANNRMTITGAGNVGVGGDTTPDSLFSVGSTSQFQINSSGIISVIDSVAHVIEDVSGNLRLSSNSTQIDLNDNVFLPAQSDLRLADSDSTNYVALQAPATIGSDFTLTLPDTAGSSGQVLSTDGSGNLSWSTVATLANVLWYQGNGALYPANSTVDLLVGGQSTASARFAVTNVNSGAVTASMSGTTAGYALSLNGDGTIATSLNRSLVLNPAGGRVGINTTSGNINDTLTVNGGIWANSGGPSSPYLIRAGGGDGQGNILSAGIQGGSNSGGGNAYVTFGTYLNTGTTAGNYLAMTRGGNVGFGTTAPLGRFVVTGTANAAGNALAMFNQTGSDDIIAASASGTRRLSLSNAGNLVLYQASTLQTTTGDLTLNIGGGDLIFTDTNTFNVGGSGSDVAYNVIGDSTAGASGSLDSDDDLYIEGNLEADGTTVNFSNATVTASDFSCTDCIDFTEFVDSPTLDNQFLLSQGSYPWQQEYTGTAGIGYSVISNTMTTGIASYFSSTYNPAGTGGITANIFNVTNSNSSGTTDLAGVDVRLTNNPSTSGNTEYALQVRNMGTSNTTDNNVTALLRLDNQDTSGTGSTVVQNAIYITNSGNISGGIVNAINIADADVTTDISFQNGETIDNDVDGTLSLTAGTVEIAGNLLPDGNDTRDLGSDTLRWQDLYLGPSSLHIGSSGDEGIMSYNTASDYFNFSQNVSIAGQTRIGNFGSNPTALGAGSMYYNTSDNIPYYYNGSTWVGIASTSQAVNYWRLINGAFSPTNDTTDLLIGSNASSSADFAFINVNSGTPTASISGNITLNSAGVIATTNQRTLTLGDANTGNLSFVSDGTTAMTILPNGNVGIGTAAPTSQLEIAIADSTAATALGVVDNAAGGSILLRDNTNNAATFEPNIRGSIAGANSRSFILQGNAASGLDSGTTPITILRSTVNNGAVATRPLFQWQNNTTALMTMDVLGNLGLGTTTPHADLHVVGNYSSNAALVIDQLNSGDIMAASVSGVTRFRVDTNGYTIAQRFSDMANDAFYLDPAATGTALNIAGDAIFGADAILNIGGNGSTVNYNLMADSTAGASGSMTTDNDLYIQSDLEVDGTTVFGNLAYTWPSSQTAGYILQTNGSGTLTWANPETSLGAYWRLYQGAMSPTNNTVDLLVGGLATDSANFAFLNQVAGGNPTASISGDISLNASGTIRTTLNRSLTLGGATTGNIHLNPLNGVGRVGINTTAPTYNLHLVTTSGNTTFAMGDADVAHGITGLTTTNTIFHIGAISGTNGGAMLTGFADQVAGAQALELRGYSGSTNPTDTVPMIMLTGARRSGTGVVDLAAAETVFQVRNNDNAADLTLLGNGDLGIGTTAPAYGLHFERATARATMMFRSFAGGDPYAEFQMSSVDGGASNIIFSHNDGATELGNLWQLSADSGADEFILNNYYLSDPGSNGSYALHIDGVTNRTILGDSRSYLGLLHLQTGGDTPAFGKAVLTINQTESNGDLFTASASGTTRFVLTNSGGMGVNTPNANLLGAVDVRGYSSSLPIATFSGSTSGVGLRVENNGSGDIFRAGVSGRHVMSVRNNGSVAIGTTQGGGTRLWVTSEGGTPFGATGTSVGSHLLSTFEVMSAWSTNDVGTANEYFMLLRTDEDGTPDNEYRLETNGQAYADGAWNGGGADVAEMYKVLGNAEEGDLVAITTAPVAEPGKTLSKSSGVSYDSMVVGVISTDPGLVAGWGDTEGGEVVDTQPVALVGRVPVKVSLENGPIAVGDPLTSASQPGVAMKATKAGRIIGYALEAYDGNHKLSAGTLKVEQERLAGSSERQPLPEPQAGTGKVMVFVNTSYFDPSIRITSSGDVTIAGNDSAPVATATYNASYNGNLLEKVDAFAQLAVANLKAGVIRTRQLLAEVRIQTPEVQTDLITPVGDAVNVKLSDNNDRFQVTNQNNQPVASIDNQGNTQLAGDLTVNGTSRLGSLLSDNASISGTATISGQLDATSARIAALEGKVAEFEQIKADTAELVTATISGTLYADNIDGFDDKVATAIQKPSLLAQLLGEPDNASTAASVASLFSVIDQAGYSATGSAIMNKSLSDLNLASTDVSIGADAAFINRYFEVNGSAYFGDSVGIANQLLIGEGTQLSDGILSYLDSANPAETVFEIQPHGQGTLSMMAGLLSLKSNGQVIVTGDLTVAGNVTVEDSLLTDLIQPTDFTNPLQVKIAGVATESGEVRESRFEIVDELGTPVATISADGRANFAGGIGVGAQDLSGNENQAETTKTSGKAVVKQGQTEMVIKSEQITSETVVQVTPLGSTNNQVLYVKSITPENPTTSEKEGQFVVGFDTALPDRDVQFTWWLLN